MSRSSSAITTLLHEVNQVCKGLLDFPAGSTGQMLGTHLQAELKSQRFGIDATGLTIEREPSRRPGHPDKVTLIYRDQFGEENLGTYRDTLAGLSEQDWIRRAEKTASSGFYEEGNYIDPILTSDLNGLLYLTAKVYDTTEDFLGFSRGSMEKPIEQEVALKESLDGLANTLEGLVLTESIKPHLCEAPCLHISSGMPGEFEYVPAYEVLELPQPSPQAKVYAREDPDEDRWTIAHRVTTPDGTQAYVTEEYVDRDSYLQGIANHLSYLQMIGMGPEVEAFAITSGYICDSPIHDVVTRGITPAIRPEERAANLAAEREAILNATLVRESDPQSQAPIAWSGMSF